MELAQEAAGGGNARPGAGELVVGAAGQVRVPSGEHGVVAWIIDVDGVRHIVHAVTFPEAARQETRLVNRMVESLTFTRG